jgi:hypothetical protein
MNDILPMEAFLAVKFDPNSDDYISAMFRPKAMKIFTSVNSLLKELKDKATPCRCKMSLSNKGFVAWDIVPVIEAIKYLECYDAIIAFYDAKGESRQVKNSGKKGRDRNMHSEELFGSMTPQAQQANYQGKLLRHGDSGDATLLCEDPRLNGIIINLSSGDVGGHMNGDVCTFQITLKIGVHGIFAWNVQWPMLPQIRRMTNQPKIHTYSSQLK